MNSQCKVIFNREMVIDAAHAYEDKLAENTNQACHFLEAFQMSPQAWSICSELLSGLTEHKLNVLFLSATMLRQKIRDEVNLLSDRQQLQLRDELLGHLKRASQTNRDGIERIMRLISLTIADMGLRMRNWPTMLCDMTYELWQSAPLALLQVVQLLGEQPVDARQRQLLSSQADIMLQMLNQLQTHPQLDTVEMWRGCLLCYAAWARGSLLPLSINQLLDHSVVVQAIALLKQPAMLQHQVYAEASECFCATISSVESHPESHNLEELHKVRARIFVIVSKLFVNLPKLLPQEKEHCAKLCNRLTEVFGGLDPSRDAKALLEGGPFCFELQVQVASHCHVGIVLGSLELWQDLADQLQNRLELELYFLYEPLVKSFVRSVYRLCQLPPFFEQLPEEQADTISSFRSIVTELLPKLADLLGLDELIMDQMACIHNPRSSIMDIELALLFVTPLLDNIQNYLPQVLEDLMCGLPKLFGRTLQAEMVHKQVIHCLTTCHIVLDHVKLRHELVQHLAEICDSGNTQLITVALHAFDRLDDVYVDLDRFQSLFQTTRKIRLNLLH